MPRPSTQTLFLQSLLLLTVGSVSGFVGRRDAEARAANASLPATKGDRRLSAFSDSECFCLSSSQNPGCSGGSSAVQLLLFLDFSLPTELLQPILAAAKAALTYFRDVLSSPSNIVFELRAANIACSSTDRASCAEVAESAVRQALNGKDTCGSKLSPAPRAMIGATADSMQTSAIASIVSANVPLVSSETSNAYANTSLVGLSSNHFSIVPYSSLRLLVRIIKEELRKTEANIWFCADDEGRALRDAAVAEGQRLNLTISSSEVPLGPEYDVPPSEGSDLAAAYANLVDQAIVRAFGRGVATHILAITSGCSGWDLLGVLALNGLAGTGSDHIWLATYDANVFNSEYNGYKRPIYDAISSQFKDVYVTDGMMFAYPTVEDQLMASVIDHWAAALAGFDADPSTIEGWLKELGALVNFTAYESANYIFDGLITIQSAVAQAGGSFSTAQLRPRLAGTNLQGLTGQVQFDAEGQRLVTRNIVRLQIAGSAAPCGTVPCTICSMWGDDGLTP